MGSLRVVFDTNALISAYGFGGKPQQCLDLAFLDEIELLTSWAAIEELHRVMEYDRLPFDETDRDEIIAELVTLPNSSVITPEITVNEVDRDPDDDKFLECAVAGDADFIISGDEHLLTISSYENIEIVTADEFLTRSSIDV